MMHETVEQGTVLVGEETVGYEIRIVDARSREQRELDARRGRPGGNIIVVVPGHGQTVHGPKKLVVAAAQLSRSKIAWCIDPVPARGGDRMEAQAIARVVGGRILSEFPAVDEPTLATLIGWSHGGSEGLLAADFDPGVFPHFLGLCPAGFVDRQPLELLYSFALEAMRILWSSVRRLDWDCLVGALRLGVNAAIGMVRDLWRSRSLARVLDDIGWAAKKVTGKNFGYPGECVLLFGAQDTVVRWRDVFPECERPEDIPAHLAAFQAENLPLASLVAVQVVEGSHVGPEVGATRFLEIGLGILGQLDSSTPPRGNAGLC